MQTIKNLAKVLSALWLIAVLALGIGGAWLTNGGTEQLFAAATGVDPQEAQAELRSYDTRREARRDTARYRADGWGDDAIRNQRSSGDWGPGS
ncbi:MAG: hypothetical protein R3D89_01215 [Sphingomonadaceae bacterium]|jgi:hypothetical protein